MFKATVVSISNGVGGKKKDGSGNWYSQELYITLDDGSIYPIVNRDAEHPYPKELIGKTVDIELSKPFDKLELSVHLN